MHHSTKIHLKVITQDGNVITLKVPFSMPLKKLMRAFCNRNGVSMNAVRFLYDGERIRPESTPWDCAMYSADCIDVMVEQRGN
jgi:hypothetical protein